MAEAVAGMIPIPLDNLTHCPALRKYSLFLILHYIRKFPVKWIGTVSVALE
jgi:hypothetical protein